MATDRTILTLIPNSFWELIALAQQDREAYRKRLKEMSREDLVGFYHHYEMAAGELKDEPYIDHMSPQLSEDGVDDVANWVVAQGKDRYTQVIDQPESIPSRVDSSPGFLGDAINEHYDRYNEPPPYDEED